MDPIVSQRNVCVKIGVYVSKHRLLNRGVPQGVALSPLLFNVVMSDLPQLTPGINNLHYADDVAVLSQEKNAILQSKLEELVQPFSSTSAIDGVSNGDWSSEQTNQPYRPITHTQITSLPATLHTRPSHPTEQRGEIRHICHICSEVNMVHPRQLGCL